MSSYLEAITALGNGSLHPGGFSHTVKILNSLSINKSSVVLDIGCGTGRSACYLAKKYGAYVFGLDNSEEMIAKASRRAFREKTDVNFILGDALNMPFGSSVADIILIESLLIFLPPEQALRECCRVLKKGGVVVDVELTAYDTLPPKARQQIKDICGVPQVPLLGEWTDKFEKAGFTRVFVTQNKLPGVLDNLKEMLYVDPHREVSPELRTNWELKCLLFKYKVLMLANRSHLGLGTFIYTK
ncbi:class I SAM-dependent methyltransferase [Pelotomaculum propionicicum]|uniref:27-O-demethylrifamycin SV methyltransferase n=1 Tax=Pelotomaculum propionicicum TaxID=258475 RepID=A0A4Y7RQK6_9FIRM|nr:class I SAM-dependent methyltransferase [Pelotomaculum propionicicum]TEB10952.1 27-O-demethylrifamycin SV methyltransferase [Pelotomaculum propionicicum]